MLVGQFLTKGRKESWHICLTTGKEIPIKICGFEKISAFPQADGEMESCHIRIKAPVEDVKGYFNRKDYLFSDISVGWPGKSHEARIFKNYPLYQECLKRWLLPHYLPKD